MIELQRIRHASIGIMATDYETIEIFARIVSGEPIPPGADVSLILAHAERMGRNLPGPATLSLAALGRLAGAVCVRIRAYRSDCERDAALTRFVPAAINAMWSLALLAVRVMLRHSLISLRRLEPVLEFIHS